MRPQKREHRVNIQTKKIGNRANQFRTAMTIKKARTTTVALTRPNKTRTTSRMPNKWRRPMMLS